MKLVDVAIPYRVFGTFTYGCPEELEATLTQGCVVEVPFRSRSIHAFVMDFPEKSDLKTERLKKIEKILSPSLLNSDSLAFFRWISDYYCHPLGEVLSVALPKGVLKVTDKQRAKAEKLLDDPKYSEKLGLIPGETEKPQLTSEQEAALRGILESKIPALLHGVTGSGKTEVYMSLAEKTLEEERSVIILVPEIALTPQLLGRFSSRFPGKVAVLHSALTPFERFVQWERIRTGHARVVVGARSAVFAPLQNIGLVVVDEEHETSYKQEDSLRYNGRDLAVVLGKMRGARVVLGSATPSLESIWNARSGKYQLFKLEQRVHKRAFPKTIFVDLKDKGNLYSPDHTWLSHVLVNRIDHALKNGNQALLYLNRLGFAHFLFCSDCGHTWRCHRCDVALTYYRYPPLLKCHYCELEKKVPSLCEACEGRTLKEMGLGTEQVEKEVVELFPTARVARLDRSQVKTRGDLEGRLSAIAKRELDIVIGTQMIAKGHDFPGISLVGILLADASLNLPDFRAFERTFQILTQVSGRAGRGTEPGEVVIQTLSPDHPVLRAAAEGRAEDFYRTELDGRKRFGFPPVSRLAMLRLQHRNENEVERFARFLCQEMSGYYQRNKIPCVVVGPSQPAISKVKNLFRWQILLKAQGVSELRKATRYAFDRWDMAKTSVQMAIDVDPLTCY